MIPRPIKSYRASNGAIGFKFDVKDFPDGEANGLYYVRGAICWPIRDDIKDTSRGYAILAAQSLATKSIVVFESTPFTNIENVVEDNKLVWEGLEDWFRAVWQKYIADSFYWSGNADTHFQYQLQLIRCKDVVPQPWMIEIRIPDQNDAINTLYNFKAKGLLVLDEESSLVNDLMIWEQSGRKQPMASVQALLTLVYGMGKYPFKPNAEE